MTPEQDTHYSRAHAALFAALKQADRFAEASDITLSEQLPGPPLIVGEACWPSNALQSAYVQIALPKASPEHREALRAALEAVGGTQASSQEDSIIFYGTMEQLAKLNFFTQRSALLAAVKQRCAQNQR